MQSTGEHVPVFKGLPHQSKGPANALEPCTTPPIYSGLEK